MNFKKVKIVDYSTGPRGGCYDLNIDGQIAEYDFTLNKTYFRIGNSGKYLGIIPLKLEMNVSNPKETLERFFKFLLLK